MNEWVLGGAALGAGLGLAGALAWRRAFLRDQPLHAWGHDWSSAEAAVRAAGEALGLQPLRGPAGWHWLADLAFSPVWLFWGDLRTRRPERHLVPWRLEGAIDGAPAHVSFTREVLVLSLDWPGALPPLWAQPPARVERPLAEQEGVRPLMPLGSPRWRKGTAALERCFALGAIEVRAERGRLSATVPLTRDTPPPARWRELLATLADLATALGG